ncbi:zinc finger protein MEP-1 isoform 1-T2 [Cochliomyia hominivorax]
MTEVDVSVPESSALTANIQNSESNNSNSNTNEQQQQLNGSSSDNSTNNNNSVNSKDGGAMEVDGVDTEEDDSQITSSTENGGGGSANAGGERDTNCKDLNAKSVGSGNEDSSNACESISQNCDSAPKTGDESVDSVNSSSEKGISNNPDTENDDTNTNDSHAQAKKTSNGEDDGGISQDGSIQSKSTNHVDETSNDNSNHTNDPLAVSKNQQKENGSVTTENIKESDGGVVDLGDDSDIEMSELPAKSENTNKNPEENDSDGAVLIGSDSENENEKQQAKTTKPPPPAAKPTEVIDDDDDDDCVVIEDDNPAPNDLTKRKMDAVAEDSQPPSKRQRNSAPLMPGQISIKDARTLITPPIVQEGSAKRTSDVNVYPVNITPATGSGPPKLVPVGAPIPAIPSTTPVALAGLGGLNATTNANILPGLTDEMFVLEAPSFIVPYIYEKPPSDQIKNVVKEIEEKFAFTKEDFDEVDKVDEFDMMTEQNKEDREEETKKKKKRRRDDGDDESWSEEEEESEDDDDDDSESGVRTKVLIKEASDDIAALKGAIKPVISSTTSTTDGTPAKPGQENYFESPLGKFFMDIGVGLVQEFVQSDLIRLQKRKMRKSLGRNTSEFEKAIAALTANMEASKKKNAPFKFNMKRCEFCNFKSESALAMANHYETPHMNGVLYKCNFCIFEIRNATEIVYHMEAVHNIKARLIKPLPYHQCPNCGFEDNGKAKLARHQPVCAKKFRPELNMAPPNDWEAPAKIPRLKPRHGLVATATAYQAMAAQAAAQKAALASIQQQQQARNLQAAALAAQNAANKLRGRAPPVPVGKNVPNTGAMMRAANQVRNPAATNVVLPNNYQLGAGGQIIQNPVGKKTTGQPSISITPLPRQAATGAAGSSPSTSKVPPPGMKPGQSPGGGKAQFVICEICDGYIKDLEQLRNHMQWMHKVKIHPKMIYNRPPLNCQKCQFRFFTDQGLERHLLGSHGLVTSSMQEAANKGKDAGRCPVCGRMYQWKLLNHVSRDHHMTLKPAHLSYKCTVCTATFGMYKQFETHVYTAHSTVAKKAMDGKKNSPIPNPAAGSSSGRNSLSAANDSLLKPLKINDEITIIPQPASKSRISNMDTHIID